MKKIISSLILVLGLVGPIAAHAAGPAPVNLLSSGNFAILSESGITDTGSHSSAITGNIGSSPITAAAMNDVFCSEVTGKIYGVDAAYVGSGVTTCFAGNPPLSNKTLVDNAVLDMQTAYNNAAARTGPTATELGAGNIGGLTIAPGLYKWSTNVTIPTSVTLSGGPNDVWIFQIAGNLNISSAGSVPTGIKVILAGGAKASNVFWQVGGGTGATLGTYSTFNGTILSAKQIIIQTGAVLNGRALAQTQVTLDANIVSIPVIATTTPCTLTPSQFHTDLQAGIIQAGGIILNNQSSTASIKVKNGTECSAPISLASYEMFVAHGGTHWLSTQQLFSVTSTPAIPANSTEIFTVAIAPCMTQVDAFYGLAPTHLLDTNHYEYPNVPFLLGYTVTTAALCKTAPPVANN